MAEVIGVAASIIQLVSFGLSAAQKLSSVAENIKSHSSQIQRLARHVQQNSKLLDKLRRSLEQDEAAGIRVNDEFEQDILSTIESCNDVIQRLTDAADVANTSHVSTSTRIIEKYTRKAKFALLDEARIDKFRNELSQCEITLQLMLVIHWRPREVHRQELGGILRKGQGLDTEREQDQPTNKEADQVTTSPLPRSLREKDENESISATKGNKEHLIHTLNALNESNLPTIAEAVNDFLANFHSVREKSRDSSIKSNLNASGNFHSAMLPSFFTSRSGTCSTATHVDRGQSDTARSIEEDQYSTTTLVNSNSQNSTISQNELRDNVALSTNRIANAQRTMWTGRRDTTPEASWAFDTAPVSLARIDAFVLEKASDLLDNLSELDPRTSTALRKHVESLQETLLAIHIRRQQRFRRHKKSAISTMDFVTEKDASAVPPKPQQSPPLGSTRDEKDKPAERKQKAILLKSRSTRSSDRSISPSYDVEARARRDVSLPNAVERSIPTRISSNPTRNSIAHSKDDLFETKATTEEHENFRDSIPINERDEAGKPPQMLSMQYKDLPPSRVAVPRANTLRRSHTQSRKGCEMCRKRHIRCDESFPQCRECTSHCVRCDYRDIASVYNPTDRSQPLEPVEIPTRHPARTLSERTIDTVSDGLDSPVQSRQGKSLRSNYPLEVDDDARKEVEVNSYSYSAKDLIQSEEETGDGQASALEGEKKKKKNKRLSTVVDPPKEQRMPKSILRKPAEKFPEYPNEVREGVAPLLKAKTLRDQSTHLTARWTKINRSMVSPEALKETGERFEEFQDHVIVLRVLTKQEVQKLANRTKEMPSVSSWGIGVGIPPLEDFKANNDLEPAFSRVDLNSSHSSNDARTDRPFASTEGQDTLTIYWNLERVIAFLQAHGFSSELEETFRRLDLHGSTFLALGKTNASKGPSLMYTTIHPKWAEITVEHGHTFDTTKAREEGKRLRKLVRSIVEEATASHMLGHGRDADWSQGWSEPTIQTKIPFTPPAEKGFTAFSGSLASSEIPSYKKNDHFDSGSHAQPSPQNPTFNATITPLPPPLYHSQESNFSFSSDSPSIKTRDSSVQNKIRRDVRLHHMRTQDPELKEERQRKAREGSAARAASRREQSAIMSRKGDETGKKTSASGGSRLRHVSSKNSSASSKDGLILKPPNPVSIRPESQHVSSDSLVPSSPYAGDAAASSSTAKEKALDHPTKVETSIERRDRGKDPWEDNRGFASIIKNVKGTRVSYASPDTAEVSPHEGIPSESFEPRNIIFKGLSAVAATGTRNSEKDSRGQRDEDEEIRGRSTVRRSWRSRSRSRSHGRQIRSSERIAQRRRSSGRNYISITAVGMVERMRSKSRDKRSRSRVRQGLPIDAAGVGAAALAGIRQRPRSWSIESDEYTRLVPTVSKPDTEVSARGFGMRAPNDHADIQPQSSRARPTTESKTISTSTTIAPEADYISPPINQVEGNQEIYRLPTPLVLPKNKQERFKQSVSSIGKHDTFPTPSRPPPIQIPSHASTTQVVSSDEQESNNEVAYSPVDYTPQSPHYEPSSPSASKNENIYKNLSLEATQTDDGLKNTSAPQTDFDALLDRLVTGLSARWNS